MTDEPITIPDFLPLELEDEHLNDAREQVHQSRHGQQDQVEPARAADGRPPRAPVAGPLGWLSGSEIPLVTVAIAIGLVGVSALTTWWSWLAMTHDPMWWGFTALGGVLLGVLVWATVAVQAHRRRLAARREPLEELALTA